MEFKSPYLKAMTEQAPEMFKELRASGELDRHLQEMSGEAHRMYREMTANEPKLPSGVVRDVAARQAAERAVLETLINFQA